MMTSANRHRVMWMRGADSASVGDGGRPEEVGMAQEHGPLRQPVTRCYSKPAAETQRYVVSLRYQGDGNS